MSNIPSSAMPHAWAPADHGDAPAADRTSARGSLSLPTLAGLGALLYVAYRWVR